MDTKSQRQKRLDSALPLLNAAINDINLANKVSSIAPAKAVYGSVGVLLTMIKVCSILFYDDLSRVHV